MDEHGDTEVPGEQKGQEVEEWKFKVSEFVEFDFSFVEKGK